MIGVYRNWPTAVRQRLSSRRRGGPDVVYRLRAGLQLRVAAGPHDVRIVNEVWLDRIYELFDGFSVRSDWWVLDLGANKGSFTIRAASRARRGKVVAVEPIDENLVCLRENIVRNELENVQVVPCAVGATKGEMTLHFDSAASGATSPEARPHARVARTNVVTLADILERFPADVDLVKMDVEGAELEVLESAALPLLDRVRRLVLEYHAGRSVGADQVAAALKARLQRAGFDVRAVAERRLIFASRVSPVVERELSSYGGIASRVGLWHR